jgi:hypothetical protein
MMDEFEATTCTTIKIEVDVMARLVGKFFVTNLQFI